MFAVYDECFSTFYQIQALLLLTHRMQPVSKRNKKTQVGCCYMINIYSVVIWSVSFSYCICSVFKLENLTNRGYRLD